IESAIFVHASGFTGGAVELDDALKMCNISLNDLSKENMI
ncbi:hypothetical protein H311_05294, partial [Anncaliia algerae PRA109]